MQIWGGLAGRGEINKVTDMSLLDTQANKQTPQLSVTPGWLSPTGKIRSTRTKGHPLKYIKVVFFNNMGEERN